MPLRLSWPAVAGWVGLTVFGMLLAGGFHFPGGYGGTRFSLAALEPGSALVGFVFGGVSGLAIAGFQGIVIKRWGRSPRAWILLNALGFGLVHALADGLSYRPLVEVGGGLILAVCQYFALRPVLSQAIVWLPLAACAWWLAFRLGAVPGDYNLIYVALILGGVTGLGLRAFFLPAAPPSAKRRAWAALSQMEKTRLVLMLALVVILSILYAFLTGLFQL